MDNKNPIIAAIDVPTIANAEKLLQAVSPHIGMAKLGLEFFMAHGAAGVMDVMKSYDLPLFLDVKLHDIPNTVGKAVRSTQAMKPAMLTVHTLGGEAMLQAALHEAPPDCLILGVTVLTSMDAASLASIGVNDRSDEAVLRLVELGMRAGLSGFVCSAKEITPIRQRFGRDVTLVTPGIRPHGSDSGDQKRVMTPEEAIACGTDYVVIGRPITQHPDPADAARRIAETLSRM